MRAGGIVLVAASAALAACPQSHRAGRWDCTGNPCGDGETCNGAETCDPERGCLPGTFVDCDDADPCTLDSCAAGACAHAPRDLDGDGHLDPCAGGDDCAPEDPAVHPGADELCNDRDDDCDLDVDERLEFTLFEEDAFDVRDEDGRFRAVDAVLDDGTLISIRPQDAVAVHGQALEAVPLRAEEATGWPTVTDRLPAVVTDGTKVWSSSLWGPALESGRERLRVFDSIVTVSASWNDAFQAADERTVPPPEAERGWPSSLALAVSDAGVLLAWTTPVRGVSEVLLTSIDDPEAPILHVARASRSGPVTDIALAADPLGSTIVWSEMDEGRSEAVWAARAGADGIVRVEVRIGEASHPRLAACTLATGTAVAIGSASSDGTDLRLLHLDRLLRSEDVLTLDSADGLEEGDEIAVRCAGASVWLVGPGWVRRVSRDGQVESDTETKRFASQLIASRGIAYAVTPDPGSAPYIVERFGCVP